MMSSGEGGSSLPSPRRRDTGALPTFVTITPWMENAPATQAMVTVPPRMVAQRRSKLTGKQAAAMAQPHELPRHEPALRWRES
jgi:hypothetical protein